MELLIKTLEGLWLGMKTFIFNPSFIVIFVLALLMKIFYPKFRGYMGEFWVKLELKKLPNKDYVILNDIMLEDTNGTHQIDHLVISKFGIFVIEMKNYYGLIIGDEYNDKWIQYLGKKKYYFKNPIHQNYGHVKALEKILNLNNDVFIPIICFSNQANLKLKNKSVVVQLDDLISCIKSFHEIQLDFDINAIASKIINLNITTKMDRKKHVEDIREKIKLDKTKEENMICPKCGGNLILRNGKYGTFIGCSNYPRCRYTKTNNI